MLEFQRMQEHYAKKKQPAPYTTLAGFRRARRAQAESYKHSRKAWVAKEETLQTHLTNQVESDIIEKQIDKSQTDGLPSVVISDKQFGKKSKRHMREFGLDVSNAYDREIYKEIMNL